ncbi:hypothetical protein ACNKHL_11865 [Shigella flexneri]
MVPILYCLGDRRHSAGVLAEAPLLNQVLVLSGIALVVTVGVYRSGRVMVKIQ